MKEELIIRYIAGQFSPEEETEILNWINQTPDNKKEYYKYLNLWALSSQKKCYDAASPKDIKNFRSLIATKSRPARFKYFSSVLKYAAIALLALLIGKYVVPVKDKPTPFALKNQIIVPLGSKSNIILPDGTTVLLNAGSKLAYSFSYGNTTREVILEGEAYFKVAKNREKPFIVQTAKASIKALGTEFNVKAYPEENRVEAILVKGSILIQQKSGKNSSVNRDPNGVILRPGQKMSIANEHNSMNPTEATHEHDKNFRGNENIKLSGKITELENAAIETSWKDERWIIQGEKLDDLAVLLSRKFNVNIHLMDIALKEYKFSGTIQNETIEQIFDIMKLAVPMTYTIEKGNVKWYINTRLEKDYKEVYKKKK
jgi:transmembrane sensor